MAQDALLNSIVLSTFRFPSNEIINLLFGWTDVPTVALLLIFQFSGHNKAFFSKEEFCHLLGKGIYLKSSVTKMSYYPSLLPDDHIFLLTTRINTESPLPTLLMVISRQTMEWVSVLSILRLLILNNSRSSVYQLLSNFQMADGLSITSVFQKVRNR